MPVPLSDQKAIRIKAVIIKNLTRLSGHGNGAGIHYESASKNNKLLVRHFSSRSPELITVIVIYTYCIEL